MAEQTINPVLPVIKIKNTLQKKKVIDKNKHPENEKPAGDTAKNKKGGIDTYA